jgi:Trk K+ transport system NAD-binding subunit
MSLPFHIGTNANTVSINLAATTASVSLGTNPYSGTRIVRVFNDDQATAFIEFGPTGVEATLATGCPIATKTYQDFEIGAADTHMAAIGTGTPNGDVYCTVGYA